MRGDLAARYWVPLICLYHGLRITKVLQFCKMDIINSEPPMLRIEVEDDERGTEGGVKRTLRNKSTKRVVPVHQKLIELGLLECLVECALWEKSKVLFPSSIPADDSDAPVFGGSYSQAFLRFLKRELKFLLAIVIMASGIL
jgi:hypothetical protein